MRAPRPVWLVRATNVGLDAFGDRGVIALDCHVRQDIGGMSAEQISQLGPSRRHAVELARVLHLDPGALVVATDSNQSSKVLVGTVDDLYDYCVDPDPQHPHVIPVAWGSPVPRSLLSDAGVRWPGLQVLAIAELEVPQPAFDLIERLAAGETVATAGARRGNVTGSPAVRRRGVGLCGDALVATIRRRAGTPASWHDPDLDEPVEPCPAGRCDHHTKHRYWLPVELSSPKSDGPNVLVVGVNPTCPDVDHKHNQTYRQVRRLASGLDAASCGMVNLASRRTADVAELLSVTDGELVGPRQQQMLVKAVAQADVVVLAYGRLDGARSHVLRGLRDQLMGVVDAERRNGLVVAQVGEFPSHPWPWSTTVPGDERALVAVLSAV